MDIDKISINEKYNILMHGITNKNITETCRLFGISRTIYYRWLKRFQISGIDGLKNIERNSPKMPNKVPKYIEKEIIKIVKNNPMLGPKRIFSKMHEDGFWIGESGIYNVLKRNKLNICKNRIEFSNIKKSLSEKEDKIDLRSLLLREGKIHAGDILVQNTNYIGKFKNIGRVYQMIAIDLFSRFVFIKIYTDKKSINAKDLLETKVIPTVKHFDIKIKNIITNKSSEFTTGWREGIHKYEEFLKKQNIKHFYIRNDARNEFVRVLKKFQKTIYKALFEDMLKNSEQITLYDLEEQVKNFSKKYNFNMTLDEGVNTGLTPIEAVVKDRGSNLSIPLWMIVDSITI